MKKLMIFLLLGMFMISFASADIFNPSTWDDKVIFHEEGRNGKFGYYEINDTTFWIFNNKPVKTIELIENEYSVFTAWNIKEIEVFKPSKLFDKTNYLDKEQKNDKRYLLSSESHLYREWETKTRTISSFECLEYDIITNGSNSSQVCINEKDNSYEEEYEEWGEWKTYNFQTVQEGLYQTKTIVTREHQGTGIIDWVDENEGHDLDKWATWWNNSWTKKRVINLTSDVGNFSYLQTINFSADMQADFDDLRFIDSATESIELNYTIENFTASTSARVRIDSQGEDSFYMYYGNAGASDNSNASNTYLEAVNIYYLDEVSGNIIDSAGNQNGTPDGISYGETVKIGDAIGFIAVNADDVVFTSDIQGDTSVTVMGWFKFTATTDGQKVMLINGNDGADEGFGFGIDGGDFKTIVPGVNWGSSGTGANTNIHSFMITRNAGTLNLYLDGSASVISTQSDANSGTYGTDHVFGGETGSFYGGDLDEVYFYDDVKTADDFLRFHTQTEPGYTVGAEELNGARVTQISPADALQTTETFQNFRCNASFDFNITNLTLVFNGTDTFTNSTFGTFIELNYSQNITQGIHNWSCKAVTVSNITTQSGNRTLTIHITEPEVIIHNPEPIINYHLLGDDLLLNWTVIETGENLTEHIKNCTYEYNGTVTVLNNTLCTQINQTNFTYIQGVNNLTFNVTDIFELVNSTFVEWEINLLELNQTYEEELSQTEFNDVEIYISSPATSITNPELIYNNVSYTSTLNEVSSTVFYLTSSIVANESIVGNNSFYWNITLDGTELSTEERLQNVSLINFSICEAPNNITYLSIDFRDELTLESINATIRISTFEYYIEDISSQRTYTYSTAGNQSSYDFCFDPENKNITVDMSISYYGTDYPERTFGTDLTLSNITTNVTLDLLDDASGLYATFKFIDSTTKVGLSGVNVLIYDGTTLVIEKTTDDSGVVSEWLNPNILYEIQYSKTGYDSGSQSIRPTTTETYLIEMISDTALADPFITNGLIVLYYPQTTDLDNGTNYNFGFYAKEGDEEIETMKFTIYDEDRNEIYSAEKSGDGNMSQTVINVSQNKTILGIYELNGSEDGYWKFNRIYYVSIVIPTQYSLDQWGGSLDDYFPATDRTILVNLIWYILWFICMMAGFSFGYNGSYRLQEDYRNNITVETRSNTNTGLFFAYIITWIFCYFNLIPFNFPYPQTFWGAEGVEWVQQYFLAIVMLIPLIPAAKGAIEKWSRRGN